MYGIEKKDWGYQLSFGGFLTAEEMQAWVEESQELLKKAKPGFGVFVDMRTLRPLPPDAHALMQEGQKLYKGRGMARSVVILASALLTLQFKRTAQQTGIYEWERYIDSATIPNGKRRASPGYATRLIRTAQ